MKIVIKSNYDHEDYTERFLEVPRTDAAVRLWSICHLINGINEGSPDYYCVVENDYQLQVREA